MTQLLPTTPAELALGVVLPSRREEDWKWTDLKRLVDKPFAPLANKVDDNTIGRLVQSSPLSHLRLRQIVIVNGKLHSAPDDIVIGKVAPQFAFDDAVLTLNAKLAAGATTLHLNGNVDQPLEILHVCAGQGAAFSSRLHIAVADKASATIVETFVGEGEYLNNPVTTIAVGKAARLDRIKIETEARMAQHLSHVAVTLDDAAIFNDFTFTAGAVLNRQNANIDFNGQHSNARVAGSYLLNGSQHADTRLVVDHKVPNCMSRELFKCVMDGKSRGIFQGKVIVRPDAQKIDGKQSSHALLLSETAEFDAKPELEIYADDVVCGHGTTCGDLNHDHLFYLRSRGIPEVQARSMLVQAFVTEAFDSVESESLRAALLQLVETHNV